MVADWRHCATYYDALLGRQPDTVYFLPLHYPFVLVRERRRGRHLPRFYCLYCRTSKTRRQMALLFVAACVQCASRGLLTAVRTIAGSSAADDHSLLAQALRCTGVDRLAPYTRATPTIPVSAILCHFISPRR